MPRIVRNTQRERIGNKAKRNRSRRNEDSVTSGCFKVTIVQTSIPFFAGLPPRARSVHLSTGGTRPSSSLFLICAKLQTKVWIATCSGDFDRYLRAGPMLVEEGINWFKKNTLPFRFDHLRQFRLRTYLA